MKVTERQLRRIIKETLHHVAAAAAAGSAQGGGRRRRSSKMNTEPDTSSLRSGSSSGSSTGTPQDLSGGKAEQMYADLRKGRSKEFFDIVDDIDMYTRAREVTVVMPKKTDENEIAVDMKIYNRDNQKGGFTKENYDEWVDNVCPILNHNMHFYLKFKKVWEGLSLMPESRLRKIIRSVIKESMQKQFPDFTIAKTERDEDFNKQVISWLEKNNAEIDLQQAVSNLDDLRFENNVSPAKCYNYTWRYHDPSNTESMTRFNVTSSGSRQSADDDEEFSCEYKFVDEEDTGFIVTLLFSMHGFLISLKCDTYIGPDVMDYNH